MRTDEVASDPDTGDPDAADAAEDPEEEEGEAAPAPEFPIIFVHGHDGGLEDWRPTIEWLVEVDPRWGGYEDSPVITWHMGLNETDDEAAGAVAYLVVVGAEDPYLSPEEVAYDHAPEPVVIPGADHTTVRSDPVLREMIVEILGN